MNNKGTVVARSVAEFLAVVCDREYKSFQNLPSDNEAMCFRGQPNCEYRILPSIARKQEQNGYTLLLEVERNMIETAKYKAPEIFREDLQPIELLALLQHHGLLTRLLDVTDNALVALFFACYSNGGRDEAEKDGEVIVFRKDVSHMENYPIDNAIADSYRFAWKPITSLTDFYSEVLDQPYFIEERRELKDCHESNEVGGDWIYGECKDKLLFVNAAIRNRRQFIQQSGYILFPNRIEYVNFESHKWGFVSAMDEIPKDSSNICVRIIIPKEAKLEILSELKLCGITRQMLFSDNTDIVCEEIKNDLCEDVKINGFKYSYVEKLREGKGLNNVTK